MPVARLYQLTGGSYFRFLVEAHALQQQRVLKVLDQGKESPKSTHELPLSNLLLEQAAEEQMSHARRGSIPMDVVESLVPVWGRAPDAKTWTNLPDSEREFLNRIDGSRRLSDLLSDDRDARQQEAELLTLQLRQGALALIPRPIQELEQDADERGTPEQRRWWRPFWKKD